VLSFLGVGASIINVCIREASRPHHDSAKGSIALVLTDKGGEIARCEVVLRAALGARGSKWRCWYANKNLGIERGSVCDIGHPLIVIDCIVDRAARIIIELNP
jgi:hypothetical protein